MFCKSCGNQLPDNAAFCPNCGASFAPAANVDPTPVTYAAPINTPSYDSAPAPSPTPILVFGIIALAMACSFWLSFVGIIFGALTRSKVNAYEMQGGQPSGMVKTGSKLGKAGLIVGIIMTVLFVVYLIVIAAIGASYFSYL